MVSIATELKSEREKRKISLAQIAAETHISLRHLESIEEGRYDLLPGGMYNRAFLKAYCESLHLDQREIIERYEEEVNTQTGKPSRHKTHQLYPESPSFKYSPLFVWSFMLLVSATGIFLSRKWIAEVFSPYFSHTPPPRVSYEPSAKPASPVIEPSAPAPLPLTDASVNPDSTGKDLSSLPAASLTEAQTPGPAPAVPHEQEVPVPAGASAAPLELEFAATEPCWISVDRDGSPALRKTLAPGEVQSLSAAEKFFVILGNAGGVQMKINGKPAKKLGKSGEVIRIRINGTNLANLIDQTKG
jgi:cytoskeleton protein RodZ